MTGYIKIKAKGNSFKVAYNINSNIIASNTKRTLNEQFKCVFILKEI